MSVELIESSPQSTGTGRHLSARRARWATGALAVVSLVLWTLVAWRLVRQAHAGLPLDFQVYRDAAVSMLHGHDTYGTRFTSVHLFFTYPPFALLPLSALVLAPAWVILVLWWLASCVALVAFVTVALRVMTTWRRLTTVALAAAISGASCLVLEPVRSSLYFGQINFLLMCALLVDLVWVRSASRGLLTGLAAAIKLTPLIYVAYFFVARSRASALRAIGTFVAAGVLAGILLPSDSVTYWLHQAFSPGHKGRSAGPSNQSWYGLVGHFSSLPRPAQFVLWLALSAVTVLVGCVLAKRFVSSERPVEAVLALALTEVLVSPISWPHHWSWIVLVPVVVLAGRHRRWFVTAAMVLVLAVAVVAPYRWQLTGWDGHGVTGLLVGFSLLFSGAALLGAMFVGERPWRRAANAAPELSATTSATSALVGRQG